MKKLETEYLVIGSGPGAASATRRLLENKKEVLMIEEGSDYTKKRFKLDSTNEMLNMWKNAALTPAFGSPSITYAEGKCVGGGSEINSGIIQRAPEEVLNDWSKLPNVDSKYFLQKIHDDYEYIEKKLNASLLEDRENLHSKMLKNVADLNNWKIDSLPRALKNCKCFEPLCNCGGRQSMTETFIKDAKKENFFKLESNTKVTKINFKKDKAISILAERKINDKKEKIEIFFKHLCLSAGTVNTPFLLMNSGLKFKGLGKFQLHPTVRVLARFKEKINAMKERLPDLAITEFMPNIRFGGSVVSPEIFGMNLSESWTARSHLVSEMNNLASYYVMIKPIGWGKISKVPLINTPLVRYKLESKDFSNINKGLKKLSEGLFKSGAMEVHPSIKNHLGWYSIENIESDFTSNSINKNLNLMSIHLFSSCSILNNEEELLDFGRFKSIKNMFLADSSSLISAPGVNPQATIMAISMRNTKFYMEHANG